MKYCIRGHEKTEENIYWHRNRHGKWWMECRTCRKARDAGRPQRKHKRAEPETAAWTARVTPKKEAETEKVKYLRKALAAELARPL